jgi:hypothetical protein
MSLLEELEQARRIVTLCEGMPELMKARMNFVVNLVTLMEIQARTRLKQRFDDSLLEGDFTFNTIITATMDNAEQRRLIREVTKIRNKFVHEGKSITIEQERIDRYYVLARTILSHTDRENHESGYKKDIEAPRQEPQEATD